MDEDIINPDSGANVERKRRNLEKSGTIQSPNFDRAVTFPDCWLSSLKELPDVSFASLYHHFIEKSVLTSARQSSSPIDTDNSGNSGYASMKGVDKGFKFFKDGHVRKIEFAKDKQYSYVRCQVLPSMRTDTIYHTKVCLKSDGMVHIAYCTCTARLGGVCKIMLLPSFMHWRSLCVWD